MVFERLPSLVSGGTFSDTFSGKSVPSSQRRSIFDNCVDDRSSLFADYERASKLFSGMAGRDNVGTCFILLVRGIIACVLHRVTLTIEDV